MTMGFNSFRQYDLFAEGDTVGRAEVWGGQQSSVPLTIREDVAVILRRAARNDMRVSISYTGPIRAPVITGAQVANLRITAPGLEPQEYPLYAAASVPRTGIFGQIVLALDHLVFGALEEDAEADGPTEIEVNTTTAPATEG
jgi:D-alanyl-D-alanine carboxypeptidase (penicillin-binding protein 5/6)